MPIFERLNSKQIDWLISKESLTKRLRTLTNNIISHHLLYDDWGIVNHNETAWIRRIEFRYKNKLWISATIMIPETSVNEETQLLLTVGKKSIGDILFQDPTLTRSDFVFYKMDNHHGWSRQSTVYFKKMPLLIAENFFSEFFNAINNH